MPLALITSPARREECLIVAAAVISTLLNGHKIDLLGAYSKALRAPIGPGQLYRGLSAEEQAGAVNIFKTRGIHLPMPALQAWELASRTPAFDVVIQMTRACGQMTALSIVKGKHSVVDQSGRLSTPFAALFSIMTPTAVAETLRSQTNSDEVNALIDQMQASIEAGATPAELMDGLAAADGMAWSTVTGAIRANVKSAQGNMACGESGGS